MRGQAFSEAKCRLSKTACRQGTRTNSKRTAFGTQIAKTDQKETVLTPDFARGSFTSRAKKFWAARNCFPARARKFWARAKLCNRGLISREDEWFRARQEMTSRETKKMSRETLTNRWNFARNRKDFARDRNDFARDQKISRESADQFTDSEQRLISRFLTAF